MKTIGQIAGGGGLLALMLCSGALYAEPCTSPLILDLDGDGFISTTGSEYPVAFDIDADGQPNSIGWTAWGPGDGFLWIDLNHNGVVDDGGELFGSGMRLPEGNFADDGFQALAVYDRAEFGGNEDGTISSDDLIWPRLRIWVDENHDARSQRREIRPLGAYGVVSIGLGFERVNMIDGNLNLHSLRGAFVKRVHVFGQWHLREQLLEDVFFVVADPVP